MKPIKTEAFELALKFINETNVNIFLTGKAGTGKTTFLKHLKENPVKNMAIAAPTGVAAINAGGVTLHSMFQLPFGPFIPGHQEPSIGFNKKMLLSRMRFNSRKIDFLNALELLVIDEASMVSSNTVDAVDTILRSVRHKNVPFGGVQVLFIGDLYQLQPVVKDDEWKVLKMHYSSNFFFDSHVLRDNIPVMIELKKIFRQKDESFIDILNGLRENTLTKEHLNKLNERLQPEFISKDGDGYITLTTHNVNASRLNEIKLGRLKTPQFSFQAEVDGEFPEHINPAERNLVLKKNAQVMFIKNDSEGKRFYNGKIGIISEISDDEIVVTCDDDEIHVGKHVWENLAYSVDPTTKDIKENLLGTFTQYPLRLAWAITIHKSQGLTFDKVVIDAENAFANGQVYVALSRATSLEGLILTSPVNDRFLGPHADLKDWQETKQDEKSLPVLFVKARAEYVRQMLFNTFSFEHFHFHLDKLKKEMEELKDDAGAKKWLIELMAGYHSLNSTAVKFKTQLQLFWNENPDTETNEKLNTRVSEASAYFSRELEKWKQSLMEHPLKVTTKKLSRPIDKELEAISEQLLFCSTKLNLCKSGFQMNEMIVWKKHLPQNVEKIKSSYHSNEKSEKAEGNNGLYELLTKYRDEIALENDILPYMIMSNQSIRNCCELLPGDEDSLLEISGFGKHKVRDYGEDVLDIVRKYCDEFGIDLNHVKKKSREKNVFTKSKTLSPTVKETLDLIKSGKSTKEISKHRKLAESTIEGHLALAIKNNLVEIDQLLSKKEIDSILPFFSEGSLEVKAAYSKAEGKVPYGKLRMVQAWLIAKKGVEKV